MDGEDEVARELDERERARLTRRDRRRTTSMVVDNAAVKRIQQALEERRARERAKREQR